MPTRFDSPIEPGDLDRVVRIQQKTDPPPDSGSGFPVEEWTDLVAAMPAQLIDLSANERYSADQISAKYDGQWVIQYRADMDPELLDIPKTRRLVHHSRVHDITAAFQLGRQAGI